MIQTMIVMVLVVGSVLHAGWALMPRSIRQVAARRLLGLSLPWPGFLSKTLQGAAVANSGCSCHGCEHGAKEVLSSNGQATAVKAQPIVFHRKYDH